MGGQAAIDPATVDRALDLLAVDDQGLDEIDRKLLTTMIEHYHGGPVGIRTIAANIGEEVDTIEDVPNPTSFRSAF